MLHQQAPDELGGDNLGGAGEEGVGVLLGERGGYWRARWLWGCLCMEVLRSADRAGKVGYK